jgi:hypothetical protein
MRVESWSFLTNHARVLLRIAQDPGARLRDIAASLGITERSAYSILTDLTAATGRSWWRAACLCPSCGSGHLGRARTESAVADPRQSERFLVDLEEHRCRVTGSGRTRNSHAPSRATTSTATRSRRCR